MSGDLEFNKILGAGLATALVILGVREVSTRLYETESPEKMGYFVEVAEEGGEAGAAAELPADWGTVLPTADLAAGEAVFKKCASCHNVASGGPNGIGPNLWGVVGRAVAGHPGFAYSDPLKAHASAAPSWTYDQLDAFLKAPTKYVPGTKMSFAGLKKQEDRVAVIAWLRQQGSGGYPIPAPDPARQPGAATTTVPDGAAGVTEVEGAQSGSAPAPSGVGGGMAGQAPAQGPGAAPTVVKPTPGGNQGAKGQDALRPGA